MSAPIVVHACVPTPEEQVSGSSAQNMRIHEQDEVDAATISTCTDGDAYTRFRTDKYHRTRPVNRKYPFANRYGCNATSFSCPSSPSLLELLHGGSASAARGGHICGNTSTHASFVSDDSESDSSLGEEATEIMGSAYNTTPPAPMSEFQPSTSTGNMGVGHKRRGSALKTVMKNLFYRRRQGSEISQGGDGEATEDDEDYGREDGPLSSRARGAFRNSPRARAGICSEPLRRNAPSPFTAGDVMPSKEIGDSDGIVGVAVTNNERETDRKPTYIRRPQALRRATLSSAAVLEVNNRASSSKSMIDAEYGHSVDTAEKNHRGISPAGSLGVWREEEPSLPDLRPRSVSVAAIREAARHVRRASDDALISRINARDVSPFPLLPNQVGGMNHASECCDTATTDSGDEAKHVSALHSFYFGAYQRDDASGIGQRVATIEVKLMDLELAISRLQVNLAKNLPSATSVPTRRPPSPPTEVAVVGANPRKRDSSQHLSPYIAEQFFKSPTPTSMGSPNRSTEEHPNSALANPIDRFVREETLALPCRHPEHKLFAPHPSSITGLDRTVYSRALEQFNDPVNMVRQEREARKALEAQVFALQRQVARLMSLGISSSACSQE